MTDIPPRLHVVAAAALLGGLLVSGCEEESGPGTVALPQAPTVSIQSPADGTAFPQDTRVSLLATATDPEDGDLSTSIAWSSSLGGELGSGPALFIVLAVGEHTLTARATDSDGLAGSTSVEVVVDAVPALEITAPADGTTLDEGTEVTLTAAASDPEDGDLSNSVAWSSSLDGEIGAGASVASILSVGDHTVTASVTDSRGQSTSASVAVTVIDVPDPPVVEIVQPDADPEVVEGTVLTFVGTATDEEQNDISASLTWASSLDGELGTGPTVSELLSQGTHDVTATVTDSDGLEGEATVTVTVTPPPPPDVVERFIWFGVNDDRQFTEEEYQQIVDTYDLVVVSSFHCGGVRACHDGAAARLKELDPDITVLAYINGLLREIPGMNENELFSQETWNDDWFVVDRSTGERLTLIEGRAGVKDLADPELRSWVIGVVQGWMDRAPWDGVAFDRMMGLPSNNFWLGTLGEEGIEAMNEGMVAMVRETTEALGQEKLVILNGFKDSQSSFDGRLFLEPVEHVDAMANEYFCHHKRWGFDMQDGETLENSVIRDVEAHAEVAGGGTAVLAHVSYGASDETLELSRAEKDRINRLCYGAFLLGHRPGYSSYKFGFLNTERLLEEDAGEQAVRFGDPLDAKRSLGGGLYVRDFTDGTVVVNLGDDEEVFMVPFDAVFVDGGVVGETLVAGQFLGVPARDAHFLIRR